MRFQSSVIVDYLWIASSGVPIFDRTTSKLLNELRGRVDRRLGYSWQNELRTGRPGAFDELERTILAIAAKSRTFSNELAWLQAHLDHRGGRITIARHRSASPNFRRKISSSNQLS